MADTVTWLKRRNIAASGQVVGTRNTAKRILAEARQSKVFGWLVTLIPRVGIVRPF